MDRKTNEKEATRANTRKSLMGAFARPTPVVPYAPDRLSVAQKPLTPEEINELVRAEENEGKNGSGININPGGVGTVLAALRTRRKLRRSMSGNRKLDEAQAAIERHEKVLSNYKIRRIGNDDGETKELNMLDKGLVNPHSSLYKFWQLATLLLILYQALVLPYSLAFTATGSGDIVDEMTNIIFGIDILIQFRTPIETHNGENEYITNWKEIAKVYMRGWLFFDLLACIPFDQLVLMMTDSRDANNLSILGLLKVLRAPRLLRLVRLVRVFKIVKIRPEVRRWLQYSRHANLFRLFRLVILFLGTNHYAACIWYGLVASNLTLAHKSYSEAKYVYFVAYYDALLVVMGQNLELHTDAEYIFCISAMIIGAVLMAVVFGNVAMLISNFYENQSRHQKKMEWLFASMTRMRLPQELQNRVNDYYQMMWERHGTLDGEISSFVPELSRNLAYEVELFQRMDMINRSPIFKQCSAKVVQELVMELELQVFMPGDYIVVRGEVGDDMYFVQSGICEVTREVNGTYAMLNNNPPPASSFSSEEVVLKTLGQGDYFGEISLLMNCKRTANVRASTFSELCVLTRDVFESISLRYLEDRSIIEKFIMQKYDPKMLEVALRQSQEVTMRTTKAATTTPTPSITKKSKWHTIHDALDKKDDILNALQQIQTRMTRIEAKLNIEPDPATDNNENAPVTPTSYGERSVIAHLQRLRQGRGESPPVDRNSVKLVSEPPRMSQIAAFYQNGSQDENGHVADEENRKPTENGVSGPADEGSESLSESYRNSIEQFSSIDGEATLEDANKQYAPPYGKLHRGTAWRNTRRELMSMGSSFRLRTSMHQSSGLESASVGHSRQSSAFSEAAAAANMALLPQTHSLLQDEPPLRLETADSGTEETFNRTQTRDAGPTKQGPTISQVEK